MQEQATIGLYLSDEILENASEVKSKKKCGLLSNVFERHALLKEISGLQKFYTAVMKETDPILSFSNRIRQLAATIKSMSLEVPQNEMAIELLNSLPDE